MIRDGIVPIKLEVDDEDTILSLMEYYKEKKPEDLRLRIYETPIEIEKPSIFSMWLKICVKVNLIAMN